MARQKKSPGGNLGSDGTRVTSSVTSHSNTGVGSYTSPICVGTKVVGYVAGGVFRKSVRGSVHFLRSPRAIAFDVSTLHDAESAGARFVEITDSETGRKYRAALSTVWAKGWAFNRGFGEQWGVPLGAWNRDDGPAQLALFGGTA